MKTQAYNPYLPFWEHVPDGEPHIFDGRVYIYGSHDGGHTFCEKDYTVWSAPVENPGDWRCEGVSYRKDQDPINGATYDGVMPELDAFYRSIPGPHYLYAPDVAKGPDGRYYLYYSLDFSNVISVAVADKPAGPFTFLSYVTRADGSIPAVGRKFDPAILSEEGGSYLYYGFAPAQRFPGQENDDYPGAMVVQLADDMHTMITEPVCIANGIDTAKGTDYETHPFFEASSIRHIGDWYYFVYSSLQGNELCYGMARHPMDHFDYKGVIISNGDLGYQGRTQAACYDGNNHGGLCEINGKNYIFWHRQTHGDEFHRQGCADEVHFAEDGTIAQVEMTSCGLNGRPLQAAGTYSAHIACNLMGPDREGVGHVIDAGPGQSQPEIPEDWPYITEEADPEGEQGLRPFIYNLRAGACAGFKYFAFGGQEESMTLSLRGTGAVEVHLDDENGPVIASVACCKNTEFQPVRSALARAEGEHGLFFVVTRGCVDFAAFTIA